MKGIYLGRCRAYHPQHNLDYNDIETLIIVFYALNIAHKIIEWLKSENFKKFIKEQKEKKNGK